MPGLNGDAVAEKAFQFQPDMPVLLMTAGEGVGELPIPWSAVIRKPFSLNLVTQAVLAAIERPSGISGR
jgi:hypothetical protein